MKRPDPIIARVLRCGLAASALPLDTAALRLLRSPSSLRVYRSGRRSIPAELLALLAGELRRQAETAPAPVAAALRDVHERVLLAAALRLCQDAPRLAPDAGTIAGLRGRLTGGLC